MPTRRLPRTDDERSAALTACNSKYQTTPVPERLITPAQFTTLQATQGPWQSARHVVAQKLLIQTSATVLANATFAALVNRISHFIQVLNFAIEDGDLPATVRACYHLPVGHAEVPVLNTYAEAIQWAGNLSAGETDRVAAGGPPMAWPTIVQVNDAADACADAEAAQSTAKSAFDNAQEALAALRPALDLFIKDIWDTIEYNLRAEDAPSLRRKAREWGVVYVGEEEEEEPPAPPVPPGP